MQKKDDKVGNKTANKEEKEEKKESERERSKYIRNSKFWLLRMRENKKAVYINYVRFSRKTYLFSCKPRF